MRSMTSASSRDRRSRSRPGSGRPCSSRAGRRRSRGSRRRRGRRTRAGSTSSSYALAPERPVVGPARRATPSARRRSRRSRRGRCRRRPRVGAARPRAGPLPALTISSKNDGRSAADSISSSCHARTWGTTARSRDWARYVGHGLEPAGDRRRGAPSSGAKSWAKTRNSPSPMTSSAVERRSHVRTTSVSKMPRRTLWISRSRSSAGVGRQAGRRRGPRSRRDGPSPRRAPRGPRRACRRRAGGPRCGSRDRSRRAGCRRRSAGSAPRRGRRGARPAGRRRAAGLGTGQDDVLQGFGHEFSWSWARGWPGPHRVGRCLGAGWDGPGDGRECRRSRPIVPAGSAVASGRAAAWPAPAAATEPSRPRPGRRADLRRRLDRDGDRARCRRPRCRCWSRPGPGRAGRRRAGRRGLARRRGTRPGRRRPGTGRSSSGPGPGRAARRPRRAGRCRRATGRRARPPAARRAGGRWRGRRRAASIIPASPSRSATSPAAARTPAWRIPPPSSLRPRRARPMNDAEPTTTEPAGHDRPFDRQNVTESAGRGEIGRLGRRARPTR